MRHVPQQCTVVICTRVQRPYETAVVINYMHWKTSKRVKRIKKEDPFWIKSKRKLACSQVKLEMECVCTTWMGFISRRNSKQKSNVIIYERRAYLYMVAGRHFEYPVRMPAYYLAKQKINPSVLRCYGVCVLILWQKRICAIAWQWKIFLLVSLYKWTVNAMITFWNLEVESNKKRKANITQMCEQGPTSVEQIFNEMFAK